MDVNRVDQVRTDSGMPSPVRESEGWWSTAWNTLYHLGAYFGSLPRGLMSQLDGIAWRSNPKEQLKKYTTAVRCIRANRPEEPGDDLEAVLAELEGDGQKDDREIYKGFYEALSCYLDQDPEHEGAQDLAEICVAKVTLSHYLNSHLPRVIGQELPDDMLEQLKAVADAPRELKGPLIPLLWQSFKAATGYEFHAAGMGNLPNLQCIIEHEAGQIECIHTGAPVKEIYWSNSIDPVFRGFLAARKRQGIPYLYVCLLDIISGERAWWDELVKLSDDYLIEFVALAQDSAFALDKTPIATDLFQAQLIEQMRKGRKCGYHFPSAWLKDPSFFKELEDIVNQVRFYLFKDVERLDEDGRAAYKQIVDALILDYLVRNKNFPSFTVACRDSADRTGRLKCIWAFLLNCVTKGAATAMGHSSMIAKKRELKACRFHDLESATVFLKEHINECRDLMAGRGGIDVTKVRLPVLPYDEQDSNS